jgi:hypothetical protein
MLQSGKDMFEEIVKRHKDRMSSRTGLMNQEEFDTELLINLQRLLTHDYKELEEKRNLNCITSVYCNCCHREMDKKTYAIKVFNGKNELTERWECNICQCSIYISHHD